MTFCMEIISSSRRGVEDRALRAANWWRVRWRAASFVRGEQLGHPSIRSTWGGPAESPLEAKERPERGNGEAREDIIVRSRE